MNLFTQNSPYYHLLKYLLFLLKHPVYIHIYKLLHKKARRWVRLVYTLSVLLPLWIFHDNCSAHYIISSSIMPKEEKHKTNWKQQGKDHTLGKSACKCPAEAKVSSRINCHNIHRSSFYVGDLCAENNTNSHHKLPWSCTSSMSISATLQPECL